MNARLRNFAALVLLEGLSIALAALLFFGWLAGQVLRGDTRRFDASIRDAVHQYAWPGLTWAMRALSLVAEPGCLIGLGIVLIVAWAREGRKTLVWLFAMTMIGAEVLDQSLKLLFHRPRPVPFFGLETPASFSFPSGHALFSCCYFGVIAAVYAAREPAPGRKIAWWAGAAVLSGGIGFSRIYLGVHYPSDVIAGYAAALVWVLTIRFVYVRVRRRGAAPPHGAGIHRR